MAIDRDWRFTYVNREAESLLECSRFDLLGREVWTEFPAIVGSVFETQYRRAVELGETVDFEAFYPPLRRWFHVRAYPAETHLTVYFHDITNRRRSEEALRVSRDRLELVVQSVDLGLWYCDLPFDKLVWNANTKEHFWLPPEAEVDIDLFFDRIHPDDRESTRKAIQLALDSSDTFDTEYRTVAPDGRIKWIRAIGKPFYTAQGVPERFDGVTVDIGPQKALLAKEQESRSEAETLNRICRALSAELDIEKLVQLITNAATEATGAQFGAFFYNVLDPQGESYQLFTISGADREKFAQFPMPRNTPVFAPTFRGEGVVRSGDILRDARYGKNPPYNGMPEGHLAVRSYLAVPVVSRSGKVIGGLFFGHSESDMFQENHERIVVALASQAATALDNAHLFHAVEQASRQAQDSANALEKSNAELQQVAYVVAHDLQEPLRTIASFTQLVERRFRGASGGEADDLVDSIVGAVRHMQTLLSNLLEYLAVSSESQKPLESVDMAALVAECVQDLDTVLKQSRATVQAGPLPVIFPANRIHLKQLILNLLHNALKYAQPGVPAEIEVSSEAGSPLCTLWVRDNGQGFAQEYSERIFGMFRRLHGRDVPGTGIGLALCKRIVEVHGGSIRAESSPGRGATIFFTLPCPQKRPQNSP